MSDDVYGHLCTITSAPWTLYGRSFDGVNGFIDMGDNSIFNFTSSDFTFLLWAKPDLSVDNRSFICRGLYNTDGYYSDYYDTGQTFIQLNQAAGGQTILTSTGALITNVWQMITMTRQGANGQLYVNKEQKATHSSLINPVSSTRNFYIGQYNAANKRFKGEIGIFIATNTYFTENDVARIFQETRHIFGV